MTGAQVLELLVRGAAVGGFAGLAIAIGRGGFSPARATGVLFCAGAAAHTLTQMRGVEAALGWAFALVWMFSVMGAGLFWAFALELFEDRARFDWRRLAPAFALLAIGALAKASPQGVAKPLWLAHHLIGAALMAHVLVVVATGWKSDLVEPRRRLRGPVLAAGAAYTLIVAIVESGEVVWRSAAALSPVAAFALLAMSMAGMAAFLRADPALFGPARKGAAPTPPAAAPALAGEDAAAAAALDRLMREERLYREAGLTIAALAARLRLPEHRVRRLINQQLGHRNFNAFLNQWRLGDATQALSDPGQRAVPISTIALDAGFQSLGPFNRAFKAETGVTPSEFRERALGSRA
jgi:AraC-like DNA-binding protein